MVTKYSNEDIKSIYRLFSGGIKKYSDTMPQYFKDEFAEFDGLYKDITVLTNDSEVIKVDVSDIISEKKEWFEVGYKLVKLFYYSVKGTGDKKMMSVYFNGKKLADIITVNDLLNILEQIKIISKNDTIKHLDSVIDNLIEHYDKGSELFKIFKSVKLNSSSEIKNLSEKKEKFIKKYNKIKYLLKGYFYGTEINLNDILWN